MISLPAPTRLQIGPTAAIPYMAPSIFNISGMSYGAISRPAVEALSRGAAKAGVWLNTGEGGLSPYHTVGGCDLVFQIGTAKYGVRDEDGNLDDDKLREVAKNPHVKMFELKLAQGAKPGKGGILPGAKVNAEIAGIRGIKQGKDSISPNRHLDINDYAELLDMIHHIREVSGKPVGFKTVIGSSDAWAEFFELIVKRGPDSAPDFIVIDGGEGGTGAAPMPLIDLVGMPIRDALPRIVDLRDEHGLKDRIRIIASGKMVNPGDVAWAICAGADFVTCARGFMFALGCIQALKCNKNTCPTGITTHDQASSGRAGGGGQVCQGGQLRQISDQRSGNHRPFCRRGRAAPDAAAACADGAIGWQLDPDEQDPAQLYPAACAQWVSPPRRSCLIVTACWWTASRSQPG